MRTGQLLCVYEPHQNLGGRLLERRNGLSSQLFITDRSKAMFLLWFILIVIVRPLSACL